jgi:hypothetical protein
VINFSILSPRRHPHFARGALPAIRVTLFMVRHVYLQEQYQPISPPTVQYLCTIKPYCTVYVQLMLIKIRIFIDSFPQK